MQSSRRQLAFLHLTMSSQQSTTSYSAIPASVARSLAACGLELTPELALQLSQAKVAGSEGASANDNTATTATAGGTTVATAAGDTGEAGASERTVGSDPVGSKEGDMKSVERESLVDASGDPEVDGVTEPPVAIPTKLIGGVRHWLAIPRYVDISFHAFGADSSRSCKACEAGKHKCWKRRVGNRCARCTTKGTVCRSGVKATPRLARSEANEAGAGTSSMNVDEPEHRPEPIDVDAIPSPEPQQPEPIDVDRSPSPVPVPQPPRRGPPRAARPAPPVQPPLQVPRSPQAAPTDDYELLIGITQRFRTIDRHFRDEIESRDQLLFGLRRYREDITTEREHAATMASMEQTVLGHFGSTVHAEPTGSTSKGDPLPEERPEREAES